jgi:hypothetical protein
MHEKKGYAKAYGLLLNEGAVRSQNFVAVVETLLTAS